MHRMVADSGARSGEAPGQAGEHAADAKVTSSRLSGKARRPHCVVDTPEQPPRTAQSCGIGPLQQTFDGLLDTGQKQADASRSQLLVQLEQTLERGAVEIDAFLETEDERLNNGDAVEATQDLAGHAFRTGKEQRLFGAQNEDTLDPVSYTHLRA